MIWRMSIVLASTPRWLGRVLGILPDRLTTIACRVVWISPTTLGQDAVKTVLLLMSPSVKIRLLQPR